MTAAEIIDKLRQERDVGSRFPVRMVFVEELETYTSLVSNLMNACDVTVNIADFCKKDVLPRFDKLREALKQYDGEQVLILSVGEYLRMCVKREIDREKAQFLPFWESMQQTDSKTRYIIPVFCCQDYFDRIVGALDERQETFAWMVDRSNANDFKQYSILVYSPQFSGAIDPDASSFEEWLRNWNIIFSNKDSATIITNLYKDVESAYGAVSIRPICDPFSFLKEKLSDANQVNKNWEDNTFWASLIPLIHNGMKFSDLVLEQLGITEFDFVSIVARWKNLNPIQKELLWLWYRVYPDDGYYSFACSKAETSAQIPARLRDEILCITVKSDDWIQQRMDAIKVLSFVEFDDTYFKALDQLPIEEMKLKLLTYETHEERAFAIRTVSSMLRNGVDSGTVVELLKEDYPSFATYLSKNSNIDKEVDEYLSWYRKNKIVNRFPGQYPKMLDFNRFDARLKVLNKMNRENSFTFWIDGFGVEWLPVLLRELSVRGIQVESTNIVTAKTPTRTKYNHQWDDDPKSEKWDRLDSLSHKGVPDDNSFFSCVAYQLEVFSAVAKRVDELLDEYEYVTITGDHGSSRLAALAFHSDDIVPTIPPKKAEVHCFGRFCELSDNNENGLPLDFMQKTVLDGKEFLVMNDYNHFTTSGNAAGGNNDNEDIVGEIHGGNTPEERLVPVIVVKRTQPLPFLKCIPQNKFVSCRNGHVETVLSFNRKISTLEVLTEGESGICKKESDDTWKVEFDGITGDTLTFSVVANGDLMPEEISLKIKGLGISQNTLGGLP